MSFVKTTPAMASSGEDRPKVLELTGNPTNAALADHGNPTPAASAPLTPPPSMEDHAPCAVGYPPVIGYPQVEGHYSTSHLHPYAYPYTTAPPVPPAGYQPTYLKCGIVMTVALAIISVLTVSIVLHVVLRPKDPVVRVYDFTVSSFNISEEDSTLTANFEANITVENPSRRLRVEFTLGSQVMYNDIVLSLKTYVPTWRLGGAGTTFIDLKMSENQSQQDPDAIKEMKGELQRTKSVSFGFMVEISGKLKHSWWWTRNVDKTFICDDLKVDFAGDPLFGSLSKSHEFISCILNSSR